MNLKQLMKNKRFVYIASAFVLCVLVMGVFISIISDITKKDNLSFTLKAVEQAVNNINGKLETVTSISGTLYMDQNLRTALNEVSSNALSEKRTADTLERIMLNAKNYKDVSSIRLYVDDARRFANQRVVFFPISDAANEPWYEEVKDKKGGVTWLKPYNLYVSGEGNKMVVSCLRSISLKDDGEVDAIIAIDMDAGNLFLPLNQVNPSVMLTSNNQVIYPIDSKVNIHIDEDMGTKLIKTDHFYVYIKSHMTDWMMGTVINAREYKKQKIYIFSLYIVMLLLTLTFSVFSIMFYTSGKLRNSIKNALMTLEYNIKFPSVPKLKYNEQLEQYAKSMVTKIDGLITECYESKLAEREAKLKTLQAQINPHFLYNTIDMIKWTALDNKDHQVAHMLDELVSYFRLSLSNGKSVVQLEEEIKLAKVYLDIQSKRFENSFEVKFNVSEDALRHYVPKLVLQPVVENAMMHGLYAMQKEGGLITISAAVAEQYLIIEIKDNGAGINVQKLQEIKTSLAKNMAKNKKGGYGLVNINMRLKIFGDADERKCGLFIDSTQAQGTTITLKMKAILNPSKHMLETDY